MPATLEIAVNRVYACLRDLLIKSLTFLWDCEITRMSFTIFYL